MLNGFLLIIENARFFEQNWIGNFMMIANTDALLIDIVCRNGGLFLVNGNSTNRRGLVICRPHFKHYV